MAIIKNTTKVVTFFMKDSSNPLIGKTGLTVAVKVGKDGGALATATNAVTELSDGWYKVTLTAAEMNGDLIVFLATATGAVSCPMQLETDNVNLDATVSSRLAASAYTTPDNSAVAAIKAKTDNLPSDPASNTNVATRLAGNAYVAPDNTTIAALATALAGLQNSVNGISNVTRLTTAFPSYFSRPMSGSKVLKLEAAYKNSLGAMDDPDNNELMLAVYNTDPLVNKNSKLYKNAACSTALDTATTTGYRKLERNSKGLYFCYYKLEATDDVEELITKFAWFENGEALFEFRGFQVVDYTNDLSAIEAKVIEVLASLPVAPDNATIQSIGSKMDMVQTIALATADKEEILAEVDTRLAADAYTAPANTQIQDIHDALGNGIAVDMGAIANHVDDVLTISHGEGKWGNELTPGWFVLNNDTVTSLGSPIGIVTVDGAPTSGVNVEVWTTEATPRLVQATTTDDYGLFVVYAPAATYSVRITEVGCDSVSYLVTLGSEV